VRPRNREVRAVQILSVEQQPAETGPWYQLEVDGVLMKMLVDTGEAVSIIPKAAYRQNFSRFELKRPKVRLEAYGGGQINVFGMITVPVTSQDGQRVWSDFYVAEARVPLLGRDMQQVLGITVRNGVSVSSVEVMAQLPAMQGFVHKVRMKEEAVPVQQKLRPLPFAIRDEVDQHLRELEQQGIIERVDQSPWISPVVVSRRRSGKIRLCIDLRMVNTQVCTSGYPIPDMEEMLNMLCGNVMYSCLDLKSAYHQLDLHEDSRSLTTFVTHSGLFRYRGCPYGLASLPQCFQKVMEQSLRGLEGV